MQGARWAQDDLLSAFPSTALRVYVVWFNMVASDSRPNWPGGILSDPRTLHFWDEQKLVGTWYGQRTGYKKDGGVLWDAFFVYGPEARWGDPPGPLVASGRPVIRQRKELEQAVRKVVAEFAKGAAGSRP